KDQAFVLFITSVLLGEDTIKRLRKRLKETSLKAKISKIVFEESEAIKTLLIPVVADKYNYNIRAVDKADYLISEYAGLKEIKKGSY
ncbi:hypothetical protein DL98DRAFT_443835, partial [Cadophora sp. DSE1049]